MTNRKKVEHPSTAKGSFQGGRGPGVSWLIEATKICLPAILKAAELFCFIFCFDSKSALQRESERDGLGGGERERSFLDAE